MSEPTPRAAAFFDLDRTLIDANSGWLYAQYERRMKRISRGQLARAAGWLVLYHFGVIDMPKAYAAALAHYVGTPESVIDRRTRLWFSMEVAHRLLTRARAAMNEHREAGRPLVILSNTSSFQARVATEWWGFDDWIANHFVTDDDGRLSGTIEEPLCYGAGKVERAEIWSRDNGVDLDASWFYSDSLSDVPMLERVGNPVVVNPDPRLEREAVRRGWPVERWIHGEHGAAA